jgi:hypothetical protein
MPQPPDNPGTNLVSLRDYVERVVRDNTEAHNALHRELQRAIDMADSAQEQQVKVALASIDRRLDQMNEFRASLEDVTKRGVSRDIFDIVTNRVTIIENTYVQKTEYLKDSDTLRGRAVEDVKRLEAKIEDRFNQNGRISDERLSVLNAQIEPLIVFKNRAVILGPILVILGGVIGAVIQKALLGGG